MKYIKKVMNILLIFVLLVPMFVAPYVVNAATEKTIEETLIDLDQQKKDLANKQTEQTLTEAQIKEVKNNITLIDANIKKGQQDVIDLNNQIAELKVGIEAKDAEIRKIITFLEVSNGESEYLEYTFGAKTFTDFIYRMAITEQLTDYNDKLIMDYNKMIESNKAKTDEIKVKEVELQSQQEKMQVEISKLSAQVASLSKEQASLEEGIIATEKAINQALSFGCYKTESISTCYSRKGTLPPDTEFWRPLAVGEISSLTGWREYWYKGKLIKDYHHGLDISDPTGTPVYSVANGVVYSKNYWPGTGYVLYIHHFVNGVEYTSAYEHLSAYAVEVGQTVTKDTIIAYVGNTGESTGSHLHLTLLYGHMGTTKENAFWSPVYYANVIDPKTKINFPAGYGSFTTRNRNCSLGAC